MGRKKKESKKQIKASDARQTVAAGRRPMKTKASAAGDGRAWFARLGPGIILLTFALVIYLPSFKGAFHLDDMHSIVDNPYVHIRNLKPATLFRAAFQDFHQNRPLSNLSLALNYYFGRLDPFGYHVVNFIFFCLTGLGIWLLLNRLFLQLGFEQARSGLAAWLCALLWSSHPLNTQAVTYIVQRHTSFAGAFSIWSIYFFHLGLEAKKRQPLFYGLCGLCAACALLCKETALTLPAMLLLYKIYFFDELKPGWLRSNGKWIVALAVFYGLGALVALRPEMLANLRRDFAGKHISAWGKFLTAPRALFWYLHLVVLPLPRFLSLFHEFPLSRSFFHPYTTAVSWLGLLLVVYLALARARRSRIFSFAVLWYLGSLAVESMPLPIEIVYDHRLYLALLSLIVPACAWPVLKAKSLKPVLALSVAVALVFGFFSFSRNRVWTSEASLWEDVLQKYPKNASACNQLGLVYAGEGRLDLAIQYYDKAIELNPSGTDAYNNRGNAYRARGQAGLSIKDFSKAVELNPREANAYYNRGLAYADQGRFDLAIQDYSKAIELGDKNGEAYNNRGAAYANIGRQDLAIEDYLKALELNPGNAAAYNNLGAAYVDKGRLDLAIRNCSKAIEIDPGFAAAYYNRGLAYKAKGQPELAQKDFNQAAELDPQFASKAH